MYQSHQKLIMHIQSFSSQENAGYNSFQLGNI